MAPGEIAAVGRHRRLADSDDSDDEDTTTKNILTTAKASDLCPVPHRLIARNLGFTSMEDMSTLSALDYVNLMGNALRSVQGLSSNTRLKTLILKKNKLSDVEYVLRIGALRILDISDNEFVTTEWLPRAAFAADLVALVVCGNKLVTLEGLACLRRIRTLVISDNEIEDISAVAQLTSLTKLSASNNCIRLLPDAMLNLHNLRELRLAHNRLAVLPSKERLAGLLSLKIFDVGHNRMESVEQLSACSGTLIQLNVAGNPACKAENFSDYLQTLCPKLEIIDGHRVVGGRRKLRINRQRLASGLPLEPERKFARPPSAYYLQKAKDEKEDSAIGQKQLQMSSGHGSKIAGSEKNTIKTRKARPAADLEAPDISRKAAKRARSNPAEEEHDDALDANQFVEMAKSKSTHLSAAGKDFSLQKSEPIRKGIKPKSKGRKGTASYEQREQNVEFGSGGSSKW